jgi:hypothetical protein
MLRLKEVASQSVTFPKPALENNESTRGLIGWPNPATTAQSFLLTGRLYWLFGGASVGGPERRARLEEPANWLLGRRAGALLAGHSLPDHSQGEAAANWRRDDTLIQAKK